MINDFDKAGFVLHSSWMKNEASGKFSGIAYTDDAVIVGQEGYKKFREKNANYDVLGLREGRFCLIQSTPTSVIARTDVLGQEVLYYFHSERGWGISNSFLALAEHLKSNGVHLHADADSWRLGFLLGPLGQGPISNDTYISDIKILPADSCIKIDIASGGFFLKIEKLEDVSGIHVSTRDEYVDSLIKFVEKSASRSLTLIKRYNERVRVDLSGGQDSRFVLATLVAAPGIIDRVNFHSNRAWADDYKVATELGRAFGFKILNKPISLAKSSIRKAYRLWKLGSLGTYLPVYPALGDAPQDALHFHGACGECYRDYFGATGRELISKVRNAYSSDLADIFSQRLASSFVGMDSDIAAPESMMIHYRHFRSRFHFGRSAYKNLSGRLITPLASPDLLRAATYLSEHQRIRFQLELDVFMLVDPRLARISFDDPRKNFGDADIAMSPFKNGVPYLGSNVKEMEIFEGAEAPAADVAPDGNFKEILLRDLARLTDTAKSTGIFSDEYVRTAADKVRKGSRMTMDAVPAAHIISVAQIAELLEGRAANGVLPASRINMSKYVSLSAQLKDNVIHVVLEVKNFPLDIEFEYAFYLLSNNKREAVEWYSRNSSAIFHISPAAEARYKVQGFIRKKMDPNSKWSAMVDVAV